VAAEPAGFIFDMDGVLIDSMPVHVQAWLQVLAERGVTPAPAEFLRATGGKTNPQILREFVGCQLGDAEIAACAEQKEQLYRALYRDRLAPVPGALAFLEAARRLGVRMAVATSAEQANREFVLGGLGLRDYFTAVVGGEEVRRGKPDPEAFLTAAGRLGLAPARCLVFEDALAGIQAASRAGMRAVALATTLAAAEFRDLPHVVQVAADFTRLDPNALLAHLRFRG
jgi:beta-phosphoglucomutase family hydrolase